MTLLTVNKSFCVCYYILLKVQHSLACNAYLKELKAYISSVIQKVTEKPYCGAVSEEIGIVLSDVR